MPKRVVRFVAKARYHETWWTEFYSGLVAFAIGFAALFTPLDGAFNTVDVAMEIHTKGAVWFLAGLIGGVIQIGTLSCNHKPARWMNAFLMSFWWCVPVMVIVKFDIPSLIALMTCLGATLANLTTVWCLIPSDPSFARRMIKGSPNERTL